MPAIETMAIEDVCGPDETYHHPRLYRPNRTWVSLAPDGPKMAHQDNKDRTVEPEEISQATLKANDALHYWFDNDAGEPVPQADYSHPTDILASTIARQLQETETFNLFQGPAPKWTRLRDNATFLFGKQLGDPERFLKTLKKELVSSYIVLDATDIKRSSNPHCHYSTAYEFKELDKKADRLIEDKLCELMNVRAALDFKAAELSDEITINGVTERKWFWESLWLTDHVLKEFPVFRTNFDTILVVGAGQGIQCGDFNQTRIFRMLGRMGRINTRLVFLD